MHPFTLPLLAVFALVSFAGAWATPFLFALPRAAHIHLALAVGVMPLIHGAMSHFVPVLTRSRQAEGRIGWLLVAILVAGLSAFGQFVSYVLPFAAMLAAVLASAASGSFAWWAWRRGKTALGSPHPCLYWYLAALLCLVLGLAAVLAMELWPAQRLALKRLHLHLNTLGFIGITAVATLQVLLPTVAGRPDKQSAARLRSDLPLALGGTLLVACGAAWQPWLSGLGLALWGVPVLRLAIAWQQNFSPEIWRLHGAAPLLAAALAGFACTLLAGVLHAAGWRDATGGAHLYIFAFLFPLVSGAVGHLLPLWLRPGQQTAWHARLRTRLTLAAGMRAVLFLAGGGLVASGARIGIFLALAALAMFLLQTIGAVLAGIAEQKPET